MRAAVLIAGIALPGCIVIALTAQAAPAGTISLVEKSPVPFPVLINGRRVMVPALRAAGQLRHPMGVRPWEVYVLDHPEQPILLEVAYGAPDAGIPMVRAREGLPGGDAGRVLADRIHLPRT